MADLEKVIECLWRISAYFRASFDAMSGTMECELFHQWSDAAEHAIALLKAQEPRVMTLEEVIALPYGYVLIETDKEGSLRWVDALLFCKNTNFSFDFITLEGRARLLGAEYNKEWRCWTSRPTDEQMEATPWES